MHFLLAAVAVLAGLLYGTARAAETYPTRPIRIINGFQAPRGVPLPVIGKLHGEINRIMTLPEVTARLAGLGIFPFTLPTPAAYGEYIRTEIKKYAEVVRGTGVKAD